MAFVTFKTELGARQVDMVFATQAEANSAAAQNPNLTAHTGNINEDVVPGDYINSAGALLSAPPAAIRNRDAATDHKAQIRDEFTAWVLRRNTWMGGLGLDDNHEDALKAADRWAYHSAATADVLVDFNYLPSLSLTNRNSFIEHIIKALRDDDRDAYERYLASKTARDAWSGSVLPRRPTDLLGYAVRHSRHSARPGRVVQLAWEHDYNTNQVRPIPTDLEGHIRCRV